MLQLATRMLFLSYRIQPQKSIKEQKCQKVQLSDEVYQQNHKEKSQLAYQPYTT